MSSLVAVALATTLSACASPDRDPGVLAAYFAKSPVNSYPYLSLEAKAAISEADFLVGLPNSLPSDCSPAPSPDPNFRRFQCHADADAGNFMEMEFSPAIVREGARWRIAYVRPFVIRAQDLGEAGKYEESLAVIEQALRISPHSPDLASQMATALLRRPHLDEQSRKKDIAEARKWTDKAVSLAPENLAILNNAGAYFQSIGNHEAALLHYEKCAEGNWSCWKNLVATLAKLGEIDRASKACASASLALGGDETRETASACASVAIRRNDYPDALRLLDVALSVVDDDQQIRAQQLMMRAQIRFVGFGSSGSAKETRDGRAVVTSFNPRAAGAERMLRESLRDVQSAIELDPDIDDAGFAGLLRTHLEYMRKKRLLSAP